MIRSIAEKLSRHIVVRRRLSRDFGRRPFYASPDSALSILKPNLEAFDELAAVCRHVVKQGSCSWDIGGNLGLFSLMAAHKAGPDAVTVCVEPDPFLASLIQKTTLLPANSDRTIHTFCSAVSDQQGIAEFLVAARGRSSNALARTGAREQAGGVRYRQYVPTVTLDSMLEFFPAPDVLKIDVEGAESMVLRGGRKLLHEVRPTLYIEVGKGETEQITGIFRDAGYDMFAMNNLENPLSSCAFNTLAVPSEKCDSVSRAA